MSQNADTLSVLRYVNAERQHQDVKWGEQNHPDGTHARYTQLADEARALCDEAATRGEVTWRHILTEEFFEATAETDEEKLRVELIQVAAVAVRWVEAIERRRRTLTGNIPTGGTQ